MQRDLVDFLLAEFRQRPGMWLGDYKLSKLPIFIAGFSTACYYYDERKSALDSFEAFWDWFEERHGIERSSNWTWPLLQMTNHNDEAALILFFSELEIFASINSC